MIGVHPGHSGAIVADHQQRLIIECRDIHKHPFTPVPVGIGQEVADDLSRPNGVGPGADRFTFHGHLGPIAERLDDRANLLVEIDDGGFHCEIARGGALGSEQVFDEMGHLDALTRYQGDDLHDLVSGEVIETVGELPGEADHSRERGPQLVADRGDEAVFRLGQLCEAFPGADTDAVSAVLGLDSRIGGKYLRGAISYGGPCFPRDNRALARVAESVGVPGNLPEATDRFNRWQLAWLADRVAGLAGAGQTVGVLGLSYKPGSDVVEEAPGTWLAGELAGRGFPVIAFDPAANGAAAAVLPASVELAAAPAECVARADLVIVATPWPEFRDIPSAVWGRERRARVVVDCWRLVPDLAAVDGVRYLPLGRSWG